jgi:pyrroline-5-carboxylate reductase
VTSITEVDAGVTIARNLSAWTQPRFGALELMTRQNRITLFGAGRMGSAMAAGWIKAGLGGGIDIVAPRPSDLVTGWAREGQVRINPVASPADVLLIAVKPQVFGGVVEQLKSWVGPNTLVLSVMAGVSLATLEAKLGSPNVVRAMPNTPGLVGKGVTLICLKPDAGDGVEAQVRGLLTPLGAVEGPFTEAELPVATALSGCGPAYGFLLAEVMAAAGIAHGLDAEMAKRLARKTVEGAGALMEGSPEDAATLRKNVTSPNGVTQAALEVLMADDAMPSIFVEAVAAAIARDQALAKETE